MAKRVRALTAAESAYLAGLIDGEGTITLARKYKGAHRHLLVSISNTERPVLEWVQRVIGAGRITTKRIYKSGHARC
ncbi:MAG: LAGLIDADG family homing endonuclease [Candidatus Bipolaricaulia bacterium]